MLPDISKTSKFVMSDEAETSSAEEQLVRNNPTNWNSLEVGIPPASFVLIIPVIYPLKNLFFYAFCPVCLGAVHKRGI